MNKLLTAIFCLVATSVFGATPSFSSFNTGQFSTAGNLVTITGNGLTNVNGTSVSLATDLVRGTINTNDFVSLRSTPGWQGSAERVPWLGNVSWNELDTTNFLRMYREKPIDFAGFNVIATWQNMFTNFQVLGAELEWNYTNFPSGPVGYRELLHTNGQRWMMWYDHINMPPTNLAQYVRYVQKMASWQPDIIWFDEYEHYANLAAQVIATNNSAIQLMFGTGTPIDAGAIKRGNAWRLHGSDDPKNWTDIKEHADLIETNAWKFSGPYSFFYIGTEVGISGGPTANASTVALQALWGNVFLTAFNETVGPIETLTNANIRWIQQDQLVLPARRALTTNGCWYLTKPMFDGSIVVGVFNTNTYTTNSTITLSTLNRGGVLPSSYKLSAPSYTVYNLKPTTAWVGDSQTTLTNTSLTASNYALFKLVPTQPYLGPITERYSPSELGYSTAVWGRVTHEGYYGPFGSGAGYLRDGLTNRSGVAAFMYIAGVPSWATNVTLTQWVVCNTNAAAWTNTAYLQRQEPSMSFVIEGSGVVTIQGTNGIQLVTYNIPITVALGTGPRSVGISWAASTNTASVRGVDGETTVTFR